MAKNNVFSYYSMGIVISWSGRLQDHSFQSGVGKMAHFQYQLLVLAKNELVLFNMLPVSMLGQFV